MSTYNALIHEAPDRPLVLKQLPTPEVPLGSALVKPLYSNIASYSRAMVDGRHTYPVSYPFTPGHSCVARIESVGADATSLKAGDIVWVDSFVTARDNSDAQFLLGFFSGTSPASQKLMKEAWLYGCFAEKELVPLENCFVLPDVLFMPMDAGGLGYHVRDMASLSFILVAYGGLELANVGPGTTVIVAPATGKFSGGGVLAALAMGAKVIAASRNEERLKTLHEFPGAQERLSTVPLKGDVEEDAAAMLAATGGKGAHVYIDISPPAASGPTTPTHFTAALQALRRNATVLLEGGLTSDISFNYIAAMLQNLTIRGKYMYERVQVEKMIRMIENGNLVVGEKAGLDVKAVFRLQEVEKALEAEGRSEWWGGNVLLAPNGEV